MFENLLLFNKATKAKEAELSNSETKRTNTIANEILGNKKLNCKYHKLLMLPATKLASFSWEKLAAIN